MMATLRTIHHGPFEKRVTRIMDALKKSIDATCAAVIGPGRVDETYVKAAGKVRIPVSGRRFRRRDNRAHAVVQGRFHRGEAVPAARVIRRGITPSSDQRGSASSVCQ